MQTYQTIEEILVDVAALLLPPEQITPSEAAEKYRFLYNPPKYEGPWVWDDVPYLMEPLDMLASVEHDAVVFVGPAQCGKTEIILNWLLYTIICDPADFYLFQTQMDTAATFSKDKVAKLHRYCDEIRKRVRPGRGADNIYDKFYRSGTRLKISWPSINQFSGHSTPRIALTDYDRMSQDVDKEGSPFFLARKRTTYFEELGMTLVESSPGQPITDDAFHFKVPEDKPHLAPPALGILSLYNQGDRRRWYWPCPSCETRFEPDFSLLVYPKDEPDIEIAAEQTVMGCPTCGSAIDHKYKRELNQAGVWLAEGQRFEKGKIIGDPRRSTIASLWLKGPAAAFIDWQTMVARYLRAKAEYDETGSHEGLKATINTDQSLPFIPPKKIAGRLPEDLENRAQPFPKREVTEGVRFLIASIDVQKNYFVVQVTGYHAYRDRQVIDRFTVRHSERLDDDGVPYPVNPGAYLEDWKLLIDKVLLKRYPLADGSGREMRLKAIACDSGGRAGVTEKAYQFYRFLKKEGLAARFQLVKGGSRLDDPRIKLSYPDSDRKDRRAGARGEIPVLMINTTIFKDALDDALDRLDPGGGYIHFPNWLESSFFEELCNEVRTAKGWEKVGSRRNETPDLFVYADALAVKLGVEKINWNDPPVWARDWDDNNLVSGNAKPSGERKTLTMEELGKELGGS